MALTATFGAGASGAAIEEGRADPAGISEGLEDGIEASQSRQSRRNEETGATGGVLNKPCKRFTRWYIPLTRWFAGGRTSQHPF